MSDAPGWFAIHRFDNVSERDLRVPSFSPEAPDNDTAMTRHLQNTRNVFDLGSYGLGFTKWLESCMRRP